MAIGRNTEVSAFDSSLMAKSPYYDDFDPDKKFLKVLFRPGQNVQARELSTLQSILQNQVERVGRHIFTNGSLVSGGEITVSNGFFVRIDSATPLTTGDLNSLVGRKITTTDITGDTIATVTSVLGTPTGTPDQDSLTGDIEQVVFFNYNTAGVFSGTAFSTTADSETTITFTSASNQAPRTGTVSNLVSVERGIFFLDGHFALTDQQTLAPYGITNGGTNVGNYRDFSNPTVSVGFDITKTIVSSSDDASLNDPASGFNNFNAPGADRLKFNPTLSQRSLTGTGDISSRVISGSTSDYIELVRIDGGLVSKKVKFAEYGDLLRTLARRTFDESGNYTVNPFSLVIDDYQTVYGSSDDSKLGIVLAPAKAYVSGYEYETIAPTKIELPKARTTETFNDVLINTPEGTFVDVSLEDITLPQAETPSGSPSTGFNSNGNNSNDLGAFAENQLLTIASGGGDTLIGTCRLRAIRPSNISGNVRLHLFNIQMVDDADGNKFNLFDQGELVVAANINSDSTANDVVTAFSNGTIVKASNANFTGFKFTFTPATDLRNLTANRQVFRIPEAGAIDNISGINRDSNFTVIKHFSGKTNSDGQIVVTVDGDLDFFDGTNSIVLVRKSGDTRLTRNTDFDFDADNLTNRLTITLNEATAGDFSEQPFMLSVPMNYKSDPSNKNIRTKTLVSQTVSVTRANSDSNIFVFDGQGDNGLVTDLYDVSSILDGSNTDVLSKFTIDDGQRVDLYDFARLILNQNETISGDTLSVTLRRFNHTYGEGGPFTRQSYEGNAGTDSYDESPKFNDPDTGESFRLFDAIDFRPVRKSINDFADAGSSNVVPFFSTSITTKVSFSTFVPRIDSLVLGEDRILRLVSGTPGFAPLAPAINEKDLELYRIFVGAYTVNENDVNARYIDSQRFTMSDIGDIEDATFTDSEFIYRSNLESQALASALGLFPGSEGVDTGIFVDDLIGHGNADVTRKQHNVSIDPVSNTLHPPFQSHTRSGTIADTASTALFTSKYGKIATAATSGVSEYISNNAEVSSGITLSVNPFGVVDYLGTIKIDPTFDRYWSESKAPKVIINVAGENNAWQKAISAPTNVSGKRLGFGTQWKDWESIWFGRKLGSETSLPQNDPDVTRYKKGTRSSYIKRVLSEKVVRKIGDKVVDLSIVPYMQSVTLNGFVEDVKPNSTHYLYFDDNLIGATSSGYQAGASGAFEFSVTIPADTYLTGERIVRVSDGLTSGDITTATSSADAIFYALGNYKTIDAGSDSIRPPIKRRDAVNTDTFLGSEYVDSLGGIGVNVFNSLDPLSQTFTVDASEFADGMCLKSVSVFFAETPSADNADATVNMQIRPVDDNGTPRRNHVIPFSEKRLRAGDVTTSDFNEFEFDAPVYLAPGTYAICLLSNDSDFRVNTTSSNDDTANLNRLFVPRNDGQRTVYTDTKLKCKVNRFSFAETEASITFTPSSTYATDIKPSALYFANARNILSRNQVTATFVQAVDSSGNIDSIPNETFVYSTGESNPPSSVDLKFSATGKVSPFIDESQCKLLAIESFVDSTINDATEKESIDERGSAIAKYYTKIVSLDKPASNIAVRLSGVFPTNTRVDVFGKFGGGVSSQTASLNDETYIKLLSSADSFRTSVPDEVTGEFPIVVNTFVGNEDDPDTDTGVFTEYQLKIVLSNASQLTGIKDAPRITAISAVPLGKITRNAFFDVVVPTGTVLPFAGKNLPASGGFIFCNGQGVPAEGNTVNLHNKLIGDGSPFGSDANNNPRVPDMRARVPVGRSVAGDGEDREFNVTYEGQNTEDITTTSRSRDGSREVGKTGGTERVTLHSHQLHEKIPGVSGSDEGEATGTRGLILFSSTSINRHVNTDEGGERGGIQKSARTILAPTRNFSNVRTNSPTRGEDGVNSDSVSNRVDYGFNTIDRSARKNLSGSEFPEQMPPFVVLNYIIKL